MPKKSTTPPPVKAVARNAAAVQHGEEQRERMIALITANVEDGGDGLTRAQLADALGISKPSLVRHMRVLIEDGRVEQVGTKVVPSTTGHIHVCRTCGHTMKENT